MFMIIDVAVSGGWGGFRATEGGFRATEGGFRATEGGDKHLNKFGRCLKNNSSAVRLPDHKVRVISSRESFAPARARVYP
eukprot:2006529-Pyramimonas_sp.AAC.1